MIIMKMKKKWKTMNNENNNDVMKWKGNVNIK